MGFVGEEARIERRIVDEFELDRPGSATRLGKILETHRTDHRGRGVGDALVGAAVRWARGQGFARIRLNVDTENAGAARLYLRHGFVVHGREPDVIRVGEDRRDEYLMHLVLR